MKTDLADELEAITKAPATVLQKEAELSKLSIRAAHVTGSGMRDDVR